MSDTDHAEQIADSDESEVALDVEGGQSEEEPQPIEIERAPPRLSQGIAIVATIFGTLSTTVFTLFALPFGIAGLAIFAGGLFLTHSFTWLTGGVALILLGTIATGAFGAVSPELMLVGVGMVILGWDIGQHALVIGEQLGRNSPSRRNQLAYTATSLALVGLLGVLLFSIFFLAAGGRPSTGVVVTILGIILMAWLYRN